MKNLIQKILSYFEKRSLRKQLLRRISLTKVVSDIVLFDGAKLCYENSKDLHELARCAFAKKDYSHTVSLSVLAAEELSKMDMMLTMSLDWQINIFDWFCFWKIFSGEGHKVKLRAFYASKLSFGENDLNKIMDSHWKGRQLAGMANSAKQLGLYVGFNKKLGRFTRDRFGRKEAGEWIMQTEVALKPLSYIAGMSFNRWKRISEMTRRFIPAGTDAKIADAVWKFREKKRAE